jgi:uridine monophosphate synthetase
MDFITKLNQAIERNNSLLCVGMDPTEAVLPAGEDLYSRLLNWARDLINQTKDLVCCYKPNIAFYEQFGPKGLRVFQDIVREIPEDIPLLLDAKRGDIGSTAEAYAKACYRWFKADAVTLSPYLGRDAIQPFVADPEKAVFVLVQTSNPSAAEVQQHGSPPLFELVARISQTWGNPGQIGLVVGATKPEALARVREICPEAWILAPGVGAQGGDLRQALQAGLREDGLGMIIPVSRSVMNAPDPRAAAAALRDEINQIRQEVAVTRSDSTPLEGGDNTLEDPHKELIDGLFETGCVKFGNFTLASGKQSPVYLDLRRLVSFPSLLELAVEAYIDALLKLEYDYIAGVPYAALPIASIAASKLKQPMVYSRKEVKTHGTNQQVEGVFESGQKAVLVEDVITSGGSLLTAAEALSASGLVADQAVVLVDREQGGVASLAGKGIAVHPVLTFSQILDRLHQGGKISSEIHLMVKTYLSEG